jgi:adenylate cyclase
MDEFELTYLPKHLPAGLKDAPSKKMLDIYLPTTSAHPSLRVRKQGDTMEITKKQPVRDNDASHQRETTIPLTEAEYADLSKLQGRRIEKTRYYYTESAVSYEVDVFEGELEGLILIDVEFSSKEDKNQFTPPEWFLADVTCEKFIAGGMLCGKRYDEIQGDLLKVGYIQKLFIQSS